MAETETGGLGMNALVAVGGAAAASVTSGMIERAAVLAERLGTAVDVLASPEVITLLDQMRRSAPALTQTLRRVEQLQISGALDTVLDLAEVVHVARISMSDTMIARLASNGRVMLEMVDVLMASGLPERAPALVQATQEALGAAVADKSFVGPLDVLKSPKQPELQFLLKFIFAFARRLPKAIQE
jgi:uncharacterized protein YjgD (DUF1641 family)